MVNAENALNARLVSPDISDEIQKYTEDEDVKNALRILLEVSENANVYEILDKLEIDIIIELIAKHIKLAANKSISKQYLHKLEKILKIYAKYLNETKNIINANVMINTEIFEDAKDEKVYSILMFYFMQKLTKLFYKIEETEERLVLVNVIIQNIKKLSLIEYYYK
ncbi:MAG: hypothetical protein QXU98_13025 [Candidatus Parvarchaeota archaeon]